MSGNIEMEVRKSVAKRTDLKYYPGWIWNITGEDGTKTTIMPSWQNLEIALEQTIIHEMKVDIVTKRNPDRQRYQKFLTCMLKKFGDLQTKVQDFEIEPIYKECIK